MIFKQNSIHKIEVSEIKHSELEVEYKTVDRNSEEIDSMGSMQDTLASHGNSEFKRSHLTQQNKNDFHWSLFSIV